MNVAIQGSCRKHVVVLKALLFLQGFIFLCSGRESSSAECGRPGPGAVVPSSPRKGSSGWVDAKSLLLPSPSLGACVRAAALGWGAPCRAGGSSRGWRGRWPRRGLRCCCCLGSATRQAHSGCGRWAGSAMLLAAPG